jgi:hypothetical protein
MSEIGDRLRAWVKDADLLFTQIVELNEIASLIDERTAELPLGGDGKPIKPGQNVRAMSIGNSDVGVVMSIRFDADGLIEIAVEREGVMRIISPEWLAHERPDSWERIADEPDAWCDRTDVDGDARGEPRALAGRIRRLASKGGER